ncbi:group I truncated hemoglobin [Alteromonas halophila]|uniref:Group 1 truncated hemoglobin n=1 Tax=Alteromonas halophila TaxID=516698 RepID=A0A918JLT2_9ALTE|nr:group 1 truncated hemoglobin [Alteromonas halophila]GGW87645.1 group 1 truncated hemoglobin [Alteromonas halophila]
MVKCVSSMLIILALAGCATTQQSLYDELGGKQTIAAIVDNFITEIQYDAEILPYFEGSDIARFRDKLEEQLCDVADGPCDYTGDTMAQVHAGMAITEHDFNLTVDLLINAMTQAGVPHRVQNKLLARLAPMRKDMLYK